MTFYDLNNEQLPEGGSILSSENYLGKIEAILEEVKSSTNEIIENKGYPELSFFNKNGEVSNKKVKKLFKKINKIDFSQDLEKTNKYIDNVINDYHEICYLQENFLDSYTGGINKLFDILLIIKESFSKDIFLYEKINYLIDGIIIKIEALLEELKDNKEYYESEYTIEYLEELELELVKNIKNKFTDNPKKKSLSLGSFIKDKFDLDLINKIFDQKDDIKDKSLFFIWQNSNNRKNLEILFNVLNIDDKNKQLILNKFFDLTIKFSTKTRVLQNKGLEVFDKFNLSDKFNLYIDGFLGNINDMILNNSLENIISELDRNIEEIKLGGLFFKNLNNTITSLDDLHKIGIDYEKYNLKDIDKDKKSEIKFDLMSLYKDNYDEKTQGNFLREIEEGLEKMMNGNKKVEFHMFYIDGKPILSSYFRKEENGELYWGGFNASNRFQEYGFGFGVFNMLLEKKKKKNIDFIVFKNIESTINRYAPLLKMYEKFGFKRNGEGKMENANFYKMTNHLNKNKLSA